MKKQRPYVHLQRRLLTAAALVALPAAALAQRAGDATQLDDIIVTGTRTEVPLEQSLVPAQVIDREEIERSQARSLPELLKGRAGINITNQGGPGKLTSLFLRGSESDHVLVLVDGVRIGSATAGSAAFQDLPVDQIERIEIVRGPRSSLYGSEAIGGVIQIFTRQGGEGFSQRLRVGAGSNSLREASAGFSNRGNQGWVSADGAYQRTDGIDACRGSAITFQGCFADEPDLDGYRNLSLSMRGELVFSEALRIEGHFLNADANNEYDGSIFGGNEANTTQRVLGSVLTWTPGERFKLTAQAGRAADKSDAFFARADPGTRVFVSTFDTRRDTAALQADFVIAEGQLLTAGGDWQRDMITSTARYSVKDRDNTAVFVEYQGQFGAHSVHASVRNDENQQFGNHSTGSLGWGMRLGEDLRLTASYGTGFKAPTFNDLYFPFGGNPDLEPEESQTLNLGVARYGDRWSWTVNVFQTHIDHLTGFDSRFNLVQVDEARIRGAEVTFNTSLVGWNLATQLSWLDPRNRARLTAEGMDNRNFDNWLPRRAPRTGRIDLDRSFGAFNFGTTLSGASARFDNAANTLRVPGHATLDLRLEYALPRDWTLQARTTNVLDRQYETIAFYNQPGREYGVSLRYAPGR